MASRLDAADGRGVPHPLRVGYSRFRPERPDAPPVLAGVEHGVAAMTPVLRFSSRSFRGAAGVDPGMIFMAAAMLLLPLGDTLSKLLAAEMDPLAVTLFRLLAQAAVLLPAAALLHGRATSFALTRAAVLSGCLVAGMLASLISAFAVMPIATAIAIFFVEPLLLTLLAGPLLGEPPGPRRLAAVAIGLLGALVVIRPGGADFGPATLLPLVAATCYALNMVVLRKASAHTPVLKLQCGATLVAAGISLLAMGALAIFGEVRLPLTTLPGWSWWAIAASGLCAALSFALIGEAFRRTEARALASFQYLEILGATAMGYVVFGDFPDAATWLGVAIILGSGLYIVQRERRIHRPRPRAPVGPEPPASPAPVLASTHHPPRRGCVCDPSAAPPRPGAQQGTARAARAVRILGLGFPRRSGVLQIALEPARHWASGSRPVRPPVQPRPRPPATCRKPARHEEGTLRPERRRRAQPGSISAAPLGRNPDRRSVADPASRYAPLRSVAVAL